MVQHMDDLRECRRDITKQLLALKEYGLTLGDISDAVTKEDLKRQFQEVIRDIFEDTFEEELEEIDAYDRAEQHREDMFWEQALAYKQAKDGE